MYRYLQTSMSLARVSQDEWTAWEFAADLIYPRVVHTNLPARYCNMSCEVSTWLSRHYVIEDLQVEVGGGHLKCLLGSSESRGFVSCFSTEHPLHFCPRVFPSSHWNTSRPLRRKPSSRQGAVDCCTRPHSHVFEPVIDFNRTDTTWATRMTSAIRLGRQAPSSWHSFLEVTRRTQRSFSNQDQQTIQTILW